MIHIRNRFYLIANSLNICRPKESGDAADHYEFESKYVAFIDVDEFLVPADDVDGDLLTPLMDGIEGAAP